MRRQTLMAGIVGCVLLTTPVGASQTPAAQIAPPSSEDPTASQSAVTLAEDPVVVPTALDARAWAGAGVTAAGIDPETVPTVVLDAYTTAVSVAPESCHITVPLLAAIGQVESGNLAGHTIDADHRVSPEIIGPRLDGGAFKAVADTDGGRLDGDKKFDRAVGPMQFLPSTWRTVAVDLDGDGERDPQDIYDAAGAAMVYLCGTRDLSDPAQLREAVLGYNRSTSYLAQVLEWKKTFETNGLTSSGPAFASFSGNATAATQDPLQAGGALSDVPLKPGKAGSPGQAGGKPQGDRPGATPTPDKPRPGKPSGTPSGPGTPGTSPTAPGTPTAPPSGGPSEGPSEGPGETPSEEPTEEPSEPAEPEIPAYSSLASCEGFVAPAVEPKPVTEADYAAGVTRSTADPDQVVLAFDGSTVYISDLCQAVAE